MNTAYFDSTVTELNKIASELNEYAGYIQLATIAGSMSCEALAKLAEDAAIRVAMLESVSLAKSAKAFSDCDVMHSKVVARLAQLAPIIAFTTSPPTNLTSVISAVTALIGMYAGPGTEYAAQEVLLLEEAALLASAAANCTLAITNAMSTITNAIAAQQNKQGCTI
jgi:hypothetical protein